MNMAQSPGLTILCKGARERETLNSSLHGDGERKRNNKGCLDFFFVRYKRATGVVDSETWSQRPLNGWSK